MRMLIKGYIFVLLVPNDLGFLLTFLPYLSLGFWIPGPGFWTPGTGFRILCHWNLHSGRKKIEMNSY